MRVSENILMNLALENFSYDYLWYNHSENGVEIPLYGKPWKKTIDEVFR